VKKIEAIIRPEKLHEAKEALARAGFVGLNVTSVSGRGVQKGVARSGRGAQVQTVDMLPKLRLEVVVNDAAVERAIQAIVKAAWTGEIGDGKIFILPVEEAVRVRTGERGNIAVEPSLSAVTSGHR
jgi:nitrogen regulatory protein P-II 1